MCVDRCGFLFFFFNDTATTEIYTLSLHDALPISGVDVGRGALERRVAGLAVVAPGGRVGDAPVRPLWVVGERWEDRKSTRLNSSHANISYAVFCLKKKTTVILSVCTLTETTSCER